MGVRASNILWHNNKVAREDRERLNGHKSCVLWFTGLSGAGKSTLAVEVEKELYKHQLLSYILDGDNIRHGLNRDLGFSTDDRQENIRRIGEVSKLFVDAGLFVVTAFISPFRDDRSRVRELFKHDEFIEVYVKCPLEECEKRDVKGLYKKARKGEIENFTGISSPYEPPISPEVIVDTNKQTVEESVKQVINYLVSNNYISEKKRSLLQASFNYYFT